MQVDRYHEALECVEEAIVLRPDDGELLLYAADMNLAASSENLPTPWSCWKRRDKCPARRLVAHRVRLENNAGGELACPAYWRETLALQPLAIDAHRNVARLLAETEGTAGALAHLQAAADRFPHFHPLYELWVEWSSPRATSSARAGYSPRHRHDARRCLDSPRIGDLAQRAVTL